MGMFTESQVYPKFNIEFKLYLFITKVLKVAFFSNLKLSPPIQLIN